MSMGVVTASVKLKRVNCHFDSDTSVQKSDLNRYIHLVYCINFLSTTEYE